MFHRYRRSAAALASLGVLFVAPPATAARRHFTYTYESPPLKPGEVEIEPWTTFRYGRHRYYHRIDQRLEFEVGLAPELQTALYWNFTGIAEDALDENRTEVRRRDLQLSSISSEWKYRLSDRIADVVGSALYFQGSLGPVEAALEGGVLVDKRMKSILVDLNLNGAYQWFFEAPGELEDFAVLEAELAGGYFIRESLFLGVELRNVTTFEHGRDFESSVIYAGPSFGYAPERWWAALSVMPQLVALQGAGEDTALELEHQERLQTRLILGFDL